MRRRLFFIFSRRPSLCLFPRRLSLARPFCRLFFSLRFLAFFIDCLVMNGLRRSSPLVPVQTFTFLLGLGLDLRHWALGNARSGFRSEVSSDFSPTR